MVKEKGLLACDSVLLKKRGWLLIQCQGFEKATHIIHRSRKFHSKDVFMVHLM